MFFPLFLPHVSIFSPFLPPRAVSPISLSCSYIPTPLFVKLSVFLSSSFYSMPPPPHLSSVSMLKPHQHDTEHTVDTVFGHYRMYTANSTYYLSALICITCLRARNVIVGHYARRVQPRVSDILGEIILAARRLRPFGMRSREAPIGRPRRRARQRLTNGSVPWEKRPLIEVKLRSRCQCLI